MVIKVGINGFGRIGRIVTRTCLQNDDLQVAAINDPAISTEYICYLLKFDSTHGKLKNNITYFNNIITFDDLQIKVFHENLPRSIPWQTAGVQYVVESSGMFASLDKASGHLENNGVKKVIVTAPSTDIPMMILGVNEHVFSPGQKVISCSSSTLYCLAPIIKVLEDNFGVSEGFITSIHAMTPSLKPLDGLCLRGKHWRDHRSIHQNIIPAATGACKALGKIIPQVQDKLSGLAFRVPIIDVSVLDLSLRLNKNINLEEIIKAVEKSSLTNMANIIKLTNEHTVSSDFMGERYSCIFDVSCSIQLKPNFYKIICWYENEYSYACRVLDSILFSERQQCFMEFPPIVRYIVPQAVITHDEILQTETDSVHVSVPCDFDDNRISKSVGSSEIFFMANSTSTKPSSGNLIIKKPLQGGSEPSVPTDYKKHVNNEIFSLCCDSKITDSTPMSRQNFGTYFKSCITLPSSKPPQDKCLNPKERLEKLRQEFSKMIDTTKDFLKKSNSTRCTNKFAVHYSTVKKSRVTSNMDAFKKHIEIKPVGDPSGESNDLKESGNTDANSDLGIFLALHTKDEVQSKVNKDIIPEPKVDIEQPKNRKVTFASAELITNIVDNLVDGMKQNIQAEGDSKELSEISISEVDLSVNCENNKSILTGQILKTPHDSDIFEDNNRPSAIKFHIFDQELKKRNIVLVDSPFTIPSRVDINRNKEMSEPQNAVSQNEFSSEEVLNTLNKLSSETVVVFSEGTSGRASPDQRERRDVYDKLDSESETDSNNSFEIHGKKSQVIHITDLTNSLEDLTRLDKICKILEISDELSDQLFSNLEETIDKNGRWSFKDLCDKIKLDEFCNKIFGPGI